VALTGTLGEGICIGTRTTARGSIEVVITIDGLERDSVLFVPGSPGVTTDDPDCPWQPDWTLPRGGGTGLHGSGPAVQTAVAPAAVEYLALRPDAAEVARAVHVPGVPGVSIFAVRLEPDVVNGALFLGDLIDAHGDAFTQQRCPRAGG
jgi:hypothetical protein